MKRSIIMKFKLTMFSVCFILSNDNKFIFTKKLF